jgi:hypothetical protein
MPKKKAIMESSDNESLLLQLLEDGYATEIVDVIPGKITASVKNLGTNDQISIEKEMESITGSNAYVLHTYGLKLLSATMLSYGNNKFETRDQATSFLSDTNLSSVIVDKLIKSQNLLEKKVRAALNIEDIDKVFFDKASLEKEQKP